MPRRYRHGLLITLICLTAASTARADEPRDPTTADVAGKVQALEQRVLNLEEQVRALKQQIQNLTNAPEKASRKSWIDRVKRLRTHNSTAFVFGPELTLLDPVEGLEIVQAAWPQIHSADVKTGLLKAFHFGKALRPKKHPQVLQILHLGMTDADPDVRRYAAAYLREFAFEDFSESPQRYADWYRQYSDKSPDEVIRLNQSHVPDGPAKATGAVRIPATLKDVADIPAQDLRVGDNPKMRYFLIGPRKVAVVPKTGYKLVIVMPGGDGGEDFHPFVRRIFKHGVSEDFLFAQPVAFKWTEPQQIVWPTRDNPVEGQKFSTEEFVEAVVGDVARQYPLNDKFIFTLSWSSSGPAAYAISLTEKTSVTGSYIAMSVFKPDYLPPLKNARNHAYVIDHSPDDLICPFRMAEAAKESLEEHGAHVQFNICEGGHGWRGEFYDRIKSGIQWLEEHSAAAPQPKASGGR